MDEFVIPVFQVVFVGCKPHQSIFLHLDSQWIDTCHHNIDPEVILEFVDQVRVHDIVGHDYILFVFQVVFFGDDFDSTAACLIGWFDNPQLFVVFLFKLVDFESVIVSREDVRHWALIEGVVIGEAAFEGEVVFPHHVFSAELKTVGEVVDSLVE